MKAPYPFRVALRSLLKEKWINLLSMLTIATGLIIISLAFLLVYNLDAATGRLPERFSISLYLDDELPREQIDRIIASIRKKQEVKSVRYIPKEEALRELKSTLKSSQYILEGLEGNPLPDSLEVKLRKEAMGPETTKSLVQEVQKIKGVAEADYGEQFLFTLHQLRVGVKVIGLTMIAILSVGIVFVCYSTVKVLFYRRAEEIETFKLLGATKWFIREPFLIEGGGIGGGGGLLSLAAVFLAQHLFLARLGASLPIFKSILFPANLFLALPVVGMILGIAGAAVALGRLRY